jgi:hypothetical protein
LKCLININFNKRYSAKEALDHPFIKNFNYMDNNDDNDFYGLNENIEINNF